MSVRPKSPSKVSSDRRQNSFKKNKSEYFDYTQRTETGGSLIYHSGVLPLTHQNFFMGDPSPPKKPDATIEKNQESLTTEFFNIEF
jgi:hypothetical protein